MQSRKLIAIADIQTVLKASISAQKEAMQTRGMCTEPFTRIYIIGTINENSGQTPRLQFRWNAIIIDFVDWTNPDMRIP